MFNGSFYVGKTAVELGLADSIGSLHDTIRERFSDDAQLKEIKVQ